MILVHFCTQIEAENLLNFRKLSFGEVFKTLKTINASKATGADGILAKIQAAAGPCSMLLTLLINLSFESGVFSHRLKIARITPIF